MPSVNENKVKRSMVSSALVGTSGFFIAKLIGLVYSIPFSSILGSDTLMSYYGSSYNLYAYFLNVATAGIPFAIATLVAKYSVLENYKSVLKVQKLAIYLMTSVGAVGALIMALLSGWLSSVMANGAEGMNIMQICLLLLSLAVFFVPILSAYRGFVQGRKEMEEYAFSQAFEQLFRVLFLLSVSCLLVYGMGMERVWALYTAVISTSIAAVIALVQVYFFVKKTNAPLQELAEKQTKKEITSKFLMRRLIQLSIPYLLAAVVGYSDSIYNAVLLPLGLKLSNYTEEQQAVMIAAVNYVGVKLTAIPMVLAPGFTSAVIPHLSESLTQRNYQKIRKDVKESINIILFIVSFLSFAIFLYAKPLFYCLFYTTDLPLSASTIRWIALEGFLNSIAPVVTSMMMALNLQWSALKRMFYMALGKGIMMVPLVMWFGIAGAVISSLITYSYLIIANLAEIGRRFHINYRPTYVLLGHTAVGLVGMAVAVWLLNMTGLASTDTSKFICFLTMIVSGLLASAVFVAIELYFKVPQKLFKFQFVSRKS